MWSNPQKTAYLVTFTEEILNGKLDFLCSEPNLAAKITSWKSEANKLVLTVTASFSSNLGNIFNFKSSY